MNEVVLRYNFDKEGQFEYFFIQIKQEDSSTVWSKESFSFDYIVAMDFL
jgi:hypothetical protein